MRKVISKYYRVYLRFASMSFQRQVVTRLSSLGFLAGKLVRFGFFLVFLTAIFNHVPRLKSYTLPEALLFFVTFNIVDILAQLFFRGIYGMRRAVVEGDFDFYLVQPLSPLFRVACDSVDFLDVATMAPIGAALIMVMFKLPAGVVTGSNILLYALLCLNAIVIAFSIHVLVASVAVRTQELENTIWLYRDLMTLGRFPADIYAEPLRQILTFVIPIAIMTTFPVKAMLGLLSWPWISFSFLFSLFALSFTLWFWRNSVRAYTSVSS